MTGWNEADHPRVPGGDIKGGQFTGKEIGAAASAAGTAGGVPTVKDAFERCVIS